MFCSESGQKNRVTQLFSQELEYCTNRPKNGVPSIVRVSSAGIWPEKSGCILSEKFRSPNLETVKMSKIDRFVHVS